MALYIEQMEKSLENKIEILKEILKTQLLLLESSEPSNAVSGNVEIEKLNKRLLMEDSLFLSVYREYLDKTGFENLSEIELIEKQKFKEIQILINIVMDLEAHFKIQSEILNERENTVKSKIHNQNKIKAYRK